MKEILNIKLYSTAETSKMLDVTEITVRSYFKQKKMIGQKIGGDLYFSEGNIKDFLNGSPIINFTETERKKLTEIGKWLFSE